MKINYLFLVFVLAAVTAFGQRPMEQPVKPDNNKFCIGAVVELESKILNEKRILNIYLPEGYNEADTTKYAVAYLLDGSADEDFIHVAGLYQYSSFEWINRTPKTIVVGIATVDRRRDYTYPTTIVADKKKYPTTGHSKEFMDFIEKELQPYITSHYNVSPSKTIIGQSLGGLFASEVLFKRPHLFSKYIIISPSIWWDNGSLLQLNSGLLESVITPAIEVYIGVGKEGLTPGELPRVMEVDANLLYEKIVQTKNSMLKVYFDYLPEEDHATISHQAIYNALKKMSSNKK